ncbi:MAG TPA: lipid-binding SYLF domain-containing protein [Acetobacteraceae bacterium]|jgi:SH3 domain-containing YSC84-like protein 1|nr:lipid-binding SYLF domain-containing protein [Acetobacteraceae bacterium]
MLHRLLRGLVPALAAFTLLAAPMAHAQSESQSVINDARQTLADLRHNPEFGTAAQAMRHARAVVIIPHLYKGGFIVGGSGGVGVMMVQARNGTWSNPAFYAIGSASFGLQIGLERSEMVLLVMTQKGLNGLLQDSFKLGASAGIAVVALGSSVEGALAGPNPPDIVVWSANIGAYGGLTLEGSILRPQPDHDRAWYGRPLTTRDILFGRFAYPPATALREEIQSIG